MIGRVCGANKCFRASLLSLVQFTHQTLVVGNWDGEKNENFENSDEIIMHAPNFFSASIWIVWFPMR